jgi:hypothetical protein
MSRSLRITNTAITSEQTGHVARLVDGGWELSWLPGRLLTRDQVTTGMTIALIVETEELACGSRLWPFLDRWATELDLTGSYAVVLASEPPAHTPDQTGDDR